MVRPFHAAVKGRARFSIEGLRRSETLRREIESCLAAHRGVTEFSVSSVTGNALVVFNSGNTAESIAAAIEETLKKWCSCPAATPFPSHSRAAARPALKTDRPEQKEKNPYPTRRQLRKSVVLSEAQGGEPWHRMSVGEVLGALGLERSDGLAAPVVEERLRRFGPNVLPEAVPRSGLSIFIDQFKSLPVALLGVAAGVSVATGGIADALVILGVVAINAVIGYTTESQSEKTIHSLKGLVRPTAAVFRDGALKEIGAESIVPGDVLVLRPGSYVAADARLVEANYLSVDESALTGESMPVMKTVAPIPDDHVSLGDRTNMVYMGTLVTGGQGLAIVIATGRFTEIGKIQALVGDTTPPETPMERQLNEMGTQLVFLSGGICGVVFLIGLLRGYGFLQMLKISISLAVAAVPEGLPTVATTTLALGIKRMRKLNVLIRHLDAVETLGSVQTICLDKTGTITLNKMTVVSVMAGNGRLAVQDGRFSGAGGSVNPFETEELLMLLHVGVLCSETEVSRHGDEHMLQGSPTENALVQMAICCGVDVITLREKYPRTGITHRSGDRNYMTTIHRQPGGPTLVAVKGSPGEVLALCESHLAGGLASPLSDEDRSRINIENERMAGEALRVLGVAYVAGDDSAVDNGHAAPSGLVWLGLVGMADPVRNGVQELIRGFHRAGIDTVMITGDQSPTAYAIGKELNLSLQEELEILDSSHLATMDPELLKALSARVHVYSRVSPANKLQIVQALQQAGKVVAMTGDGINDGPALKAADIGIAMGHTGTDVAREVADVILEDDNLETMIIAVSQGRTIYNNIRKSVHFLLSTNLSEIMVMFTSIAAGAGQPLNAMQLLWINLVSDIAPGLALALEAPEPDVLTRPPRKPDEPIVRRSDFKRIAFESAVLSAGALGAYGYGIARYGIGPRASTMSFMSLTTGQLLHAFSCRSETHSIFGKEKLPANPYLSGALAVSLGLQGLVMVVPGLRSLLGVAPIGLGDLIVIGGTAAAPLLINEATKKQGAPQ